MQTRIRADLCLQKPMGRLNYYSIYYSQHMPMHITVVIYWLENNIYMRYMCIMCINYDNKENLYLKFYTKIKIYSPNNV